MLSDLVRRPEPGQSWKAGKVSLETSLDFAMVLLKSDWVKESIFININEINTDPIKTLEISAK